MAGMTKSNYAFIESGERDGSLASWSALQEALRIPDSKMWGIIKEK